MVFGRNDVHRKSSPQHFLVFRDFQIFRGFGGLKVGGFPKNQCFFRIHRTQVRKQSAKQSADQAFKGKVHAATRFWGGACTPPNRDSWPLVKS